MASPIQARAASPGKTTLPLGRPRLTAPPLGPPAGPPVPSLPSIRMGALGRPSRVLTFSFRASKTRPGKRRVLPPAGRGASGAEVKSRRRKPRAEEGGRGKETAPQGPLPDATRERALRPFMPQLHPGGARSLAPPPSRRPRARLLLSAAGPGDAAPALPLLARSSGSPCAPRPALPAPRAAHLLSRELRTGADVGGWALDPGCRGPLPDRRTPNKLHLSPRPSSKPWNF